MKLGIDSFCVCLIHTSISKIQKGVSAETLLDPLATAYIYVVPGF